MVCEGNYYFPINISSHYYVYPKNKSNKTIVSMRKIINGNVNVKFYDSKEVVPSYLRPILHKYFSSLTLLHAPVEEYDNIIKNRKKVLNFRDQF